MAHVPLELYPKDSAFADQKWSLAIMVPEEDIKDTLVSSTLRLAFMFTLLMLLGILLSFLSKRYIKPITSGLDIIKSNDLSETPKTGILEINELIEYLASQSEEIHKKQSRKPPLPLLMNLLEILRIFPQRNARSLTSMFNNILPRKSREFYA